MWHHAGLPCLSLHTDCWTGAGAQPMLGGGKGLFPYLSGTCRSDGPLAGYPCVEVGPKHTAVGQAWPGGFGTALVSLPSSSSCSPFLALFSPAAFGLLPAPPLHLSSSTPIPISAGSSSSSVSDCSAQGVWLPSPWHFFSSSSSLILLTLPSTLCSPCPPSPPSLPTHVGSKSPG